MVKPTQVLSAAGDYEEAIERYAKHLGKDRIRRRVFDEIYGRVKRLRSKKEILAAIGMDDQKAQQVQNALEYLYRHQLVVREENDGRSGDLSRYIYGKAEFIRANKEKIIALADNPQKALRTATKRRPSIPTEAMAATKINKRTLAKKKHLNVLYLTANTDEDHPLRVSAEVRNVQEAVRGSRFRDNISLEIRPAANLDTLINGLNDKRPQIVHFAGHGNDDLIVLDDGDAVSASSQDLTFGLFAKALSATDTPPDVVVLNSCESSGARGKVMPPVKVLISMRESVSDIAANAFAVRFYAALAGGQSVMSAYNQGCVGVASVSIDEVDTPELFAGAGVDTSLLVLV